MKFPIAVVATMISLVGVSAVEIDFHAIKVNGKQSKITDDDLLAVADRFAIGTAPRVLGEVKSAIGRAG